MTSFGVGHQHCDAQETSAHPDPKFTEMVPVKHATQADADHLGEPQYRWARERPKPRTATPTCNP